jgi:dipicolinate synthase subunit A
VILPLPAVDGKGVLHTPLSDRHLPAGEVLTRLNPGQLLLAGRASPWLKAAAESWDLTFADYFEQEELALRNAIPTAEGAIRIAMEALPITLHGARVLILGFGRLGLALGPRLRSLGAQVFVAARRREQRVSAELLNLNSEAMEGMKEWLHSYDLIVNTVPAQVLGVEELAALKEGAVVIDLASLPGGVDDESAAALNVKVIHALGLPGKESPLTAARYLRDTVYHLLESLV